MRVLSVKEHFSELKTRVLQLIIIYILIFAICYYYKERIYHLILSPLISNSDYHLRKIIYTGLAEAFFTYIKLAAFSSFVLIIPFISLQIYLFIREAFTSRLEKQIARMLLIMVPILFWVGSFFVFYYIMPKAWEFFLSFENNNAEIPIVLEAKISEYLNIVIQLIVGFGLAFQLPVIIIILNMLKLITAQSLVKKRRIAIVINFIIAAILTPPDIISQFALAIPMLLLYEISVIVCKFIESRR